MLIWTPNTMPGQPLYIERFKAVMDAKYPDIKYVEYNELIDGGKIAVRIDFADEAYLNVQGARIISPENGT